LNNYGFEVERSTKKDKWIVLGFVEGHGNSYSPKEYEFIDDLSSFVDNTYADSLKYRLKQIDLDGAYEYYFLTPAVDLRTITGIDHEIIPAKFELFQNYPNPFNPTTTIKYSIPALSRQSTVNSQHNQSFNQQIKQSYTGLVSVELKVYNILGCEVAVLVNEAQRPGIYHVEWNASNYPSGIYLYKIAAQDKVGIRKMVFLR
jgi:hypothetical protein